jgi:hypothetical protein
MVVAQTGGITVRNRVLNNLRARLGGWLLLRSFFILVGLLAGAALLALLLDATVDLSDAARVATPWLLGALALGVFIVFVWQLCQLNDRRIARQFESANPQLGSRLTNAVQLADQTCHSDVGEFLRREAVTLGQRSASEVRTAPLMRRGVLIAMASIMVIAVAWLAFVQLGDDVLRVVLPRFTDPRGDHPPFSRLQFEVTPARSEVLYGNQLEVRATVRGRPVDKLWVVARGTTNETRSTMFLAPDRSFFQTLVNLREPTEFFVTDGKARSKRFPISIRYTPRITFVEMSTAFPEYTGRTAKTAKLSDEVQSFPEETRVTFRAASNRPLRDGELVLTPLLGGAVRRLPLTIEAQNTMVGGGFTLTEPTSFTLTVRDVNGLACAEPRQGRFKVLPDERPQLAVLEPGRNAVATPSIKVPVRVQAQDDYGVSRVVWLRGHNRSIERPFNMKVELKNGPQSVEAAGAFDLEKLGVRAGDEIEYYFEAADNYPKGPNVALSKLYKLQVISKEQYEQVLKRMAARKALFEPYFKLSAWLRRMAERARNLQDAAAGGTEAEKKSLGKDAADFAEDLQKYREELAKVGEQALMFDVEQAFRTALALQDTAVKELSDKLKKSLAGGSPSADDLKDMARALTKMSEAERENVSEPAQNIASVAQVIARADVFTRLAREEATVAQLLRRFAEQTNSLSRIEQMEVQELAHQQRRIHTELQKLLTSLPELLAQVPAETAFDNLRKDVEEFLKAVRDAKIEDDVSGSAKSLGDLDSMTGQALAQLAADKMAKLIAKCQGMPQQGQACLRFKPQLQSSLGNSLQQILDAMGAGQGQGQGGQDGYSMFNDDVALYGPNVELAGQQAGGRAERSGASGRAGERITGEFPDASGTAQTAPGRVRLQPDAKFPLRYREIVGDYFKAIAEDSDEGGQK